MKSSILQEDISNLELVSRYKNNLEQSQRLNAERKLLLLEIKGRTLIGQYFECPSCKCRAMEYRMKRGDSICRNCGFTDMVT